MAKQQSFADKVNKARDTGRKMAKLVICERKPNGHYSFKTKMVEVDRVKEAIAEARS